MRSDCLFIYSNNFFIISELSVPLYEFNIDIYHIVVNVLFHSSSGGLGLGLVYIYIYYYYYFCSLFVVSLVSKRPRMAYPSTKPNMKQIFLQTIKLSVFFAPQIANVLILCVTLHFNSAIILLFFVPYYQCQYFISTLPALTCILNICH
jgi:hypothetical protein